MYLLAGWLRDNEESGQGCHGVSAGHEACRVEEEATVDAGKAEEREGQKGRGGIPGRGTGDGGGDGGS